MSFGRRPQHSSHLRRRGHYGAGHRALALAIGVAAALAVVALPASAIEIKPDHTFAGDGRTAMNLPGYEYATDIVIDGNTSYVIGDAPQKGSKHKGRMVVTKYGPGGHVDRSFGSHGRAYVVVGDQSRAFGGALAPDGGILLAGWSVDRKASAVIVKLRPNGGLDRDFSGDGVSRVVVNQGVEWPLVEVEPDGGIWLGWSSVKKFDYDKHDSDYRVMHFTRGGRIDRSFSDDGVRTFDVRRQDFSYFSTVDSNGRFYLAGLSNRSENGTAVTAVISVSDHAAAHVRTLNPWGNGGSFPLSVDIDGAGQVVMGLSPYNRPGWGAARLSPLLDLDHSYGHSGYARHDCHCKSSSGALTSQGLVLVGNDSGQQQKTVIARFNAKGGWDRQLGNATYNLFPDWEYWIEAEVDAQERLLLAGTVKDQSGDIAIARMTISPV